MSLIENGKIYSNVYFLNSDEILKKLLRISKECRDDSKKNFEREIHEGNIKYFENQLKKRGVFKPYQLQPHHREILKMSKKERFKKYGDFAEFFIDF